MARFRTILLVTLIGSSCIALAAGVDPGNRDVLRIVTSRADGSEFRVAIEVHNDEKLSGMDIPIRFGRPGDAITLTRVEWSSRVDGWEAKHAVIDSANKTVIIGLISVLLTVRPNSELTAVSSPGESKVVELVFTVAPGFTPHFETFTTEHPGHYLAFFYDRNAQGGPYVEEFTPEFEVRVADE